MRASHASIIKAIRPHIAMHKHSKNTPLMQMPFMMISTEYNYCNLRMQKKRKKTLSQKILLKKMHAQKNDRINGIQCKASPFN